MFRNNLSLEGAWKFANEVVVENGNARGILILEKDHEVAKYVRFLKGKGWIERVFLKIIRKREIGTVKEKIEALRSDN